MSRASLLFLLVAFAACGQGGSANSGADGPTGAMDARDATTDGGGPADAPRDTTSDSSPADGPSDAPADVPSDTPADAPSDAPADGGGLADGPSDAGPDAGDAAGVKDAGDAGASCAIHAVFGDHVIGTGGRVYWTGGNTDSSVWTPITVGGTDGGAGAGVPLDNVSAGIQSVVHACALRQDGTVWCWATGNPGSAPHGELGDGTLVWPTRMNVATEVQVQPASGSGPTYLSGITSLMADSENYYGHPTCAIDGGGHVWCWGPVYPAAGGSMLLINSVGTPANGASPYAVQILASATAGDLLGNVTAVSAGDSEICVIRGGSVACWGVNTYGGLGTATKTGGSTADSSYPVPVAGLPASPAPTQISVSNGLACALVGGEVYCWGSSAYGAVGTGNDMGLDCAGIGHYCEPPGTAVEKAPGDGGAAALTGVARIYAGYSFGCAIDGAGALWCWGDSGSAPALFAQPFTLGGGGSPSHVVSFTSRSSGFLSGARFALDDGTYYVGTTNHAVARCP